MAWFRRLVREPLAQFTAIGLVLFVADLLTRQPDEDSRTIEIDAGVQQELADLFREARGTLPTVADMDEMVEQYVKNEVLYREARSLELDHGDDMVRERLAQRMRLLMYGGITVDDPPDDALRAWFDERKDRYATAATMSFRVIGVDGDEEEARSLAAQTQARAIAGEVLKPAGYHMVNFQNRPRGQLVSLFNEAFIGAIEALPVGEWSAAPSPRGWQVVEHLGGVPSTQPSFEKVRDAVLSDWRNHQIQTEARAALEALRRRYPVIRSPYLDSLIRAPDQAESMGERAATVYASDTARAEHRAAQTE